MTSWCQRFQDYGNRQGGLDVKYISDRYQKGLQKVHDVCERRLKTVLQEDFDAAQHQILTQCHGMGVQNQMLRLCFIKSACFDVLWFGWVQMT